MRPEDKRVMRKLKKSIKKDGNKKRRSALKKNLKVSPETAHEANFDYGLASSKAMNDLYKEAVKRVVGQDEEE